MIAVKMAMIVHVRTVPGGGAVQVDLAHETALDEGIQTVVNRCHGNVRKTLPNSPIHLVGGGMIPFLEQNFIDVTPLRSESEAVVGHPTITLHPSYHVINITHTPI